MKKILFQQIKVYDGTEQHPSISDVLIDAGRIVEIGQKIPIADAQVINGAQKAIAPGFIDVHTHDDLAIYARDKNLAKISQGVTTVVTGNCGISPAPSPLKIRNQPQPPIDLLGSAEEMMFSDFDAYIQTVRDQKCAINLIALVGHTTLRARHMDSFDRPANDQEIIAMCEDLDLALHQGAWGFSTGLAYAAGKFSSTKELRALLNVVKKHDRIWTTHMRDERTGVVASVAETIDLCRQTGVRTLISHHKCCGTAAVGLSKTTLALIDEAREQGLPLCFDVYPYTASSTVLIPQYVRDSRKVDITWSQSHPEMAGKDLQDIAREWGIDEMSALEKLQPGGAIYHQMDDADLERIMAHPDALIGSDGLPNDVRPHPRLWGAFPRVLGHYARDCGLMSLPAAVSKMTSKSAETFGLSHRGKIEVGHHADLVVFDEQKVLDQADYADPTKMSSGIEQVYVAGELAFADTQITGLFGEVLMPSSPQT